MNQADPRSISTPIENESPRRGPRYWLWGIWITWCVGASLAALWIADHARSRASRGDGRNIESYGFDLHDSLVSLAIIEASGTSRDELPAPLDPPTIAAAEISPQTRLAGVRKLRSTERVIGVVIDGEARAYPLWVMVWNEIVNDTVAGQPIVVTYSGLCDSAAVFDRRITSDDGATETAVFGFSGLLMNSNLLLYDRRDDEKSESLWSQLQARAIIGPAAKRGAVLRVLPSTVVTWDVWRTRYPGSRVMLPDVDRAEYYKRDPYLSYLGSDELRFDVRPLPDRTSREYKTPVIAVQQQGGWMVCEAKRVSSPIELAIGDAGVIHSFWFAWYAAHPDAVLVTP